MTPDKATEERADRLVARLRRHQVDFNTLLSSAAVLLAAYLFAHSFATDSRITQSRIDATKVACHEKNVDRAVQRKQLLRSLGQLRAVSDEALRQFGITREQAQLQIEGDIHDQLPLNCKEKVALVRESLK